MEGAAESARRKTELRRQIRAIRDGRPLDGVDTAGRQLAAAVLSLPEVASARCVAAYASYGTEAPTGPLLDDLTERGVRVLLPVLLPDHDLDWAVHLDDLVSGPRAALEPSGPRLGKDAVHDADAVVVPALAVSRDGVRLGQGGGSYDRALARTRASTTVVALLRDDDELLDAGAIAADAWDRPVQVVVTPSGVSRL